jgi:hypothetical protein
MYLAEIHGKLSRENENREDILTSNVFSFFKYTDRVTFFYPFLKSLGFVVTPEDAVQAEFIFWPSFPDGTQPDLVIVIGRYYLLFEAKYHSGFGQESEHLKHQLVREIEGGALEAKNLEKLFKIITVTAHYFKTPDLFIGVPKHHHKDLIWINWQSIAYLIYDIMEKEPKVSAETILFAEDLYQLLLKKNLRNFEGVNVLSKTGRLPRHDGAIFFDARTAMYRGDFFGFLPVLGQTRKVLRTPTALFFRRGKQFFEPLRDIDVNIVKIDKELFYQKEGLS